MSDPMADIRASFFVECEELMEALQDGLTAIEAGDADPETINVCFRAVHSMKGGAGAFGLDELVRFAHRYETVMDEVRAGRLIPDSAAMMLFFRAADVLADIMRASRDGESTDAETIETVLTELEALAGGKAIAAEEEDDVGDFQPMTLSLDLGAPPALTQDAPWTIVFTPHREVFASGNEPLHLLRALAHLGETHVECLTREVPALDALDPDAAYLSWRITLESQCPEADIREVFDFVDGIADLAISGGAAPTLPALVDLPPTLDDDAPEAVGATPPPAPGGTGSRLTLAPARSDSPAPSAEGRGVAPSLAPAPPPSDRPAPPPPETEVSGPDPVTKQAGPSQPKPTVRVDLDRIDRLVNLVGELVINQAMLSQSVLEADFPSNSPVSQGLEEFMQLTRDIQDSVMMIRAQPVKSLFQRMSRIVREASAAVDKRVRLITEGESTEVDKTVIERLADPLTHMIRNAVDHGLESQADRIAAGKPAEGIVRLTAVHRSGRVVIEISDDGGGINRPRVREIAEAKGLIPPGLSLSDAEIDHLLFLPGFSTAREVSNLSGRGVGMDVVRSSIQELGGRIVITSEPGVGTTFSISLPLTLAVLDGMVVRAAGETLVVPLNAIVETLSLQDDEVESIGSGVDVLHIRGAFVPLLDLAVALGFREPLRSYNGSVVLLITQEDGTRVALIVDSIEEQRQVVIKGLQDSYGHVPGIAAATILGDGQIALILDPADLMTRFAARSAPVHDSAEMVG